MYQAIRFQITKNISGICICMKSNTIMKNYTSDKKLLFIVSRGRSGTTLLSRILNMHSKIVVAPESMFIMSLYGKYGSIKHWHEKTVRSFYKDLWLDDRLVSWSLDRQLLLDNLLAAYRQGTNKYADFCGIVYQTHAISQNKPNAPVLCDKNPHYSLLVKQLNILYPNAKFLHVMRDYRANILSYQRVKFDANDTSVLAYRWNLYNQEILNYRKLHENQFLQVRFEDLLTDFENRTTNICQFVGLDYEPEMAEFHKQPQSSVFWHVNINKTIQLDRIDEWRKTLTKKDITIADSICGNSAQQFNYTPVSPKVSNHFSLIQWLKFLYAFVMTKLEQIVFSLPLWCNSFIIKQYRILTGSYAKKTE